ncbi:hypothetical protein ACTJIJ_04070 [Niabella sp. 22666]|uniref:hypothetical protein n=1 Tax=Niabella sp. 22666 TaxID=3453954 RepID=UPI003F836CE9
MKATIYSHMEIIGTTQLEAGDISMGGVWGVFHPNETYIQKIQQHAWNSTLSYSFQHQNWTALKLNILLDNGMFLLPAGGITFDDHQEFPEEQKRIYLAGIDTKIIEDFIATEAPRPFVEEPWDALTIEEKLMYEKELETEIRCPNSLLKILSKKHVPHILSDACFSAICKDQCSDDILFEIDSRSIKKRFAIVHLTWLGKPEKPGFPTTTLYNDYDEFKYFRMYPDKANWEY